MSAWIVSKTHIDFLVTAMAKYGTLDMDAHRAGRKLWAENTASVAYRYPDDKPEDLPGPIRYIPADTYQHETYTGTIEPVKVLKAINCYEYQSCEHPNSAKSWEMADPIMTRIESDATAEGYTVLAPDDEV